MREMHSGRMIIEGSFRGMLDGTAIIPAGARADISGMIKGMLIAESGAHVRISGMVHGPVVNHGATIEVTGMVTG